MSLSPKEQLDILTKVDGIIQFEDRLRQTAFHPLKSQDIDIFQINLGKLCNLSCKHCHVEAGPNRKEIMSKETLEKCLNIIACQNFATVDLTGGAPEMNPYLEWFLNELGQLNRRLIVRTNLVILSEEPYKKFIDLYKKNNVEIACSLPDLHAEKTDRVRGKNTFDKSIEILKRLNDVGYGKEGTGLILNLVHNSVGAYLSAEQQVLEQDYKKQLYDRFQIQFNRLFALSNIPIGRYLDFLLRSNNYKDYMQLLADSYNPKAVENVMCRYTLSVGWDGQLYDCDFNQMLMIPVNHGSPNHIDNFDREQLKNREIMIFNHCYGCTAGSGSSCQGVIS